MPYHGKICLTRPYRILDVQGRLPIDNSAINDALELGVTECLRQLQKTNPSLLLTALELRKAERDARYVPAVALALASIVTKSVMNPDPAIVERIRQWQPASDRPTNVVTLSADEASPHSLSPIESKRSGKAFNTAEVERLGMQIEGRLRLFLSQPGGAAQDKKKREKIEEEGTTSEKRSPESAAMHIDWDLLDKTTKGAALRHADHPQPPGIGTKTPDDATDGEYDDWL